MHSGGLFLLVFITAAAVAQEQDFTYSTNNGTITITGYTGAGGVVTIPGSISGLPVTSIGTAAFQNVFSLTNVIIPTGVNRIGDQAFLNCWGITNVTIPDSVT